MTSTANADSAVSSAGDVRKGLMTKQVCPFCGHIGERGQSPCPQCRMEDTPGTRQATRSKLGPWFVLQLRNPAAPGMSFETLQGLIRKGRVTPRSVVRGPTTQQLWRYAGRVKGISREFGLCWNCGHTITGATRLCPECKRLQEPPINPDILLEGMDAPPTSSAAPGETTAAGLPGSSSAHPAEGRLTLVGPNTPQAPAGSRIQVVDIHPDTPGLELAAFQLNNRAGARHAGRAGWIFFTGLLILLMGAAAALYIEPKLGRQAVDRLGAWWDHLAGEPQVAAPPAGSSIGGQKPAKPPVESAAPLPVETRVPLLPAVATQPSLPPPTQPAQAHAAEPARPPAIDLNLARARFRELYKRGIDAEAARDYDLAVDCYEAILKLPPEVHPTDLQLRLVQARKEAHR